MARPRVIMLGLDGFDLAVADRLLAEGRLPALARLRERGAGMLLDHGKAKHTGLAWEHVSTGLSPAGAQRWAAVDFDPARYTVLQRPTNLPPFPAALGCRTVVFDAPYFDLAAVPDVRGLVSWGAHDPGTSAISHPAGLAEEIRARFGNYPAAEWIYGFVWAEPERAGRMAAQIVEAVDRRSAVTAWLLGERLPDWDLAFVVAGEYHSAAESLWHGIDPDHPLADLPSAQFARAGLEGVYEAGDGMLAMLLDRFPDANIAAFNLHGMGPNDSDVASMALLPELMHRHAFGRARLRTGAWPRLPSGVPLITSGLRWAQEVNAAMAPRPFGRRAADKLKRKLLGRPAPLPDSLEEVGWMPASRYRLEWPRMPAFALPAYYDGRIRINLKGREARGRVEPRNYESVWQGIAAMLRQCRDLATGEPIVREIDRASTPAAELGPSEADMTIIWNGACLGLSHPTLGDIGPLPYHRTGGHSGATGIAYFAGPGINPGSYPTASAFDVLPTVVALLGEPSVAGMSGEIVRAVIKR